VIPISHMYEISRQVFKVEFAKAFGAVGSLFGESRSVNTNVSSDYKRDHNNRKQKTYCDGKEMKIETYHEKKLFRAMNVPRLSPLHTVTSRSRLIL
jgi:hypothetical protein